MSSRPVVAFSLFVLLACAAGVESAAAQSGAAGAERGITVLGEGRVRVAPDLATVTLGVEVIRQDARAASDEAARLMAAVLDALRDQGLAEADARTSFYNIWVERPYPPDAGAPVTVVYHVSNQLQVTLRDLARLTTTLGAAIEAGANSMSGITFAVEEPADVEADARREAMADARRSAEQLAELGGVALGEVVAISDVAGPTGPLREAAFARGMGGDAGPVVPGEVEVVVPVLVTYAID